MLQLYFSLFGCSTKRNLYTFVVNHNQLITNYYENA